MINKILPIGQLYRGKMIKKGVYTLFEKVSAVFNKLGITLIRHFK